MYENLVVHCEKQEYDVYIGRPSAWENPFIISKDVTRTEVIEKHKTWLLEQPELLAQLPNLAGKRLGCWCSPKSCHGHVLAELANISKLIEL